MEELNQDNIQSTVSISNKLDSIDVLFRKTWILYKQKIWTLAGITAITIFLMALIFGFGFIAIMPALYGNIINTPILALGILVCFFIMILLGSWLKSAMIVSIHNGNQNFGIKNSLREAKKYIWKYFVVSLAMMLVIFGGFILFFIPGVIVGIMISFALYILIAENESGLESLVKSRNYVRGNWWAVFGRLALMMILMFVVNGILSIIPVVGQIFVALFVSPFIMVYMYTLYTNLKGIHDGGITYDNRKTKNIITALAIISLVFILLIPFLGINVD